MCLQRECARIVRGKRGQATVEAAFLIPILFVLLLLLIQPGIVLYDRMVMQAAAAEGCRLLATQPAQGGLSEERIEALITRRLGSIPPQDLFHCHEGGCSWRIEVRGGETSETTEVVIGNRIEPLPVMDVGASLAGILDADGRYSFEVSCSAPTQPQWVSQSSTGIDPQAWVEQWREAR